MGAPLSDYRDRIYSRFLTYSFGKSGSVDEFTLRQFRVLYGANQGRFLPKERDAAILDIGCGMGHFLDYLKREGYTNIHGIDVGEEPAEFCRKNFLPNVSHVDDPLCYLEENRDKFDAVILNHVIEHLWKDEIFPYLEAIRKALKPGGIFILSTPNMAAITGCFMRYITMTHEVGFTEFSLETALEVGGFVQVRIYPELIPGMGPGRLLRRLIRWALHKGLWFLFRAEQACAPRIYSTTLIAIGRKPELQQDGEG